MCCQKGFPGAGVNTVATRLSGRPASGTFLCRGFAPQNVCMTCDRGSAHICLSRFMCTPYEPDWSASESCACCLQSQPGNCLTEGAALTGPVAETGLAAAQRLYRSICEIAHAMHCSGWQGGSWREHWQHQLRQQGQKCGRWSAGSQQPPAQPKYHAHPPRGAPYSAARLCAQHSPRHGPSCCWGCSGAFAGRA